MRYLNCKNIFFISIMLLLLSLSCGKQETGFKAILDPEEKKWLSLHRDEIYFAPDPFYAPFEFYDEKDKSTKGLAHDYISLIGKKLDVTFRQVHASTFSEILSLAKERKVSIVNAATKTPERSEYLLFTEPIVEIKNIIIVRKGGITNLSLEKLNGKKVSLVQGYAITEHILKNYPEIIADIVPADLNAILNVSYRISDAAVIDLATASYITDKEGISNIEVAGDSGYPVKLAIGSRSDWPELNRILNKGLAAITYDERNEIYRKWISLKHVSLYQTMEFRMAAALIVFLFVIAGAVFVWNKQLQRRIMLRTLNLKNAMDDLRESERILNITQHLTKAGGWEWNVSDQTMIWTEETYLIHDLKPGDLAPGSPEHITRSRECYPPESRELISEAFRRCVESGVSYDMEFPFTTAKGRRLWIRTTAEAIWQDDRISRVVGNIIDITDSKLAEERIKKLLNEKELLLQEVHHRIKNNMNTIKGLLSLQISSEKNQSAAASLREAESRVQSMIMLYDRLYCTDNYHELSVKSYLQPLTEEITGSFPKRAIVNIKTEIDDFILNIRMLSPLGIIVNELLTNMMKYAFTGRESGLITITASMKNNHAGISISDDGVGIPDSISFEKSTGFGLELVQMLILQIGGSIKIERGDGTKFLIEFDV